MIHLEDSISIKCNPETAFDYVADLSNRKYFFPAMYSDARLLTPHNAGIGARIAFKIEIRGKKYPTENEIVGYNSPRTLVEQAMVLPFQYSTAWFFEPVPEGTHVRLRTDYTSIGGSLGALLDRLFTRPILEQGYRTMLNRLKTNLEAENAPAG